MTASADCKKEMTQALEHLREELRNIRTGRANPALVEGVLVEVYGTSMRLQELASVSAPEPQQLLISPFDANNCGSISKAIEKANLGVQPITEGNVVRINIPPMDKARREEMVKQCKKLVEDAKISIRNVRRKYNDQARSDKSSGEITEDVMHRIEKDVQKLTDDFCREADEIGSAKEKEVTTI